ncbi:MAG: ArsR/SmtB family transcription factor [Anaerolineales bacterium]
MDLSDLAQFFKALSDETRLQLIALLARQEAGQAMCVSRLARALDTTTPNVSQHLRVLKELDLVYGERRGYQIHYYLNGEQLAAYTTSARELLGDRFLAKNPHQQEV